MIPIFEPDLSGNEREYLVQCAETGWVSSQGRFIPEFEAAFARYHGVPFGVATSNCTTALHLSLAALDIGPGDEVLCPDLTFIAPANMVHVTGATPVLVDVQPVSWGIDPERMREAITERTKAVIVVHPFGHTADMDPIMEIARAHGLAVIEDVAEAPGALYKDQLAGSIGDLACFSFFANKIITCGEGGMVLTRESAMNDTLRVYRDHGMNLDRKYVHDVVGFNYRMTNMQAAVGLAQFERLGHTQERRNRQAAYYAGRFGGNRRIIWRPTESWCTPVHWLATISLRHDGLRDRLLAHLKDQGIDGRQMVYPVHEARPYRDANDPARFPVSRSISLRTLHLPSSTTLTTDQLDRICDTVLDWVEKNDP